MSAFARDAHSLEERVRMLPLDGTAPDLAVDGFAKLFGSSVWCVHRMQRTAKGFAPAFLEQTGFREPQVRQYFAALSASNEVPFLYDPERPAAIQRNRIFALRDLQRVVAGPAQPAHRLLSRVGLDGQDQLRVILCDGPVLLGWVGGFREAPFNARDKRALERLMRPLSVSLLWRKRLEDANLARAGFDAALEAIGCPAFVVRGRAIAHANESGRKLLAKGARDLGGELRAAVAAGSAEAIAVHGTGLLEHEVVILRDRSNRFGDALARAANAWSLTPRQREVLGHLVCGDSNKSIASKLACAEVTVELHVTAILRKAHADGRSELTARVWSGDVR